MEGAYILKLLMALTLVLSLMGGLFLALRYLGIAQGSLAQPGKQKRLKVKESLMLDPRHRLVLIERDDKEHLVILSANGETVVESGITPPQTLKDNAV